MELDITQFRVNGETEVDLSQTSVIKDLSITEEEIRDDLIPKSIDKLRDLQVKLFAEEKQGILVVLQAMDAAGKDEAITFIFSKLSAQGLRSSSFKKPTDLDLKHDYLWRFQPAMPERGEISILNRSYYEEVIGARVQGQLEEEPIPENKVNEDIWDIRYRQLRDFERYLTENGFPVVKFFLNVSKDVQKDRLLERMKDKEKNWDFSFSDVEDRDKWDDFQDAFKDMIRHTATDYAPWYVLPADDEWLSRYLISEIMVDQLERLDPQKPVITDEDREKLDEYIKKLENE
ncbi:PPK2 family polyphosphate kinase [Atopococcus tabaci]|uniref:PPK2 family polyphosphate kinase n=1 Tax=Atopococcus tabaci TaxID=269774 RepID=UPI00041D9825|nr:phosphate--nucleotide phosphotransferase [Atopococcus tabaci]